METTRLSLALLLAFAASVYCIPAQGAVGDPCAKNPCSEGGTCSPVDPKDHVHCNCTGTKCDCKHFDFLCKYPDPCNEFHCQNGGTCLSSTSGDLDVPKPTCYCVLNQGYYGEHCENRNDFCDSNPCKNGGTCWAWGPRGVCFCPMGILGKFCEENHCDSKPCKNGGTCYPSGKDFFCGCSDDYFGLTCEWKRYW